MLVGRNRPHKYIKEEGIRMRIFRLALIISFMLLGLLNPAVTLGFEAGSDRGAYMGEFCWQDPEGGIAQLAITKIGDGHYLVTGRHTDTSGNVEAVIGNGEVDPPYFIVHITSSSFDVDEVRAFLATLVLDLPASDLSGTMQGVNIYYDKSGGVGGVSYDGAMALTRVPCP
jgi:hypothetical protein